MTDRTRTGNRASSLFGVALLALGTLACASLPGSSVHQSERDRIAYALAGEASPVVVFESGLGDRKEVWQQVFGPVSQFARVLAYDRAGYGATRTGSQVRDGATIVSELRSLLGAIELEPPYVLVGHSLGGHFVELFARLHPEEVAGIVFVDARHVDFSNRCEAEGVERCSLPWFTRALMPTGARAELRAAARTEQQIRQAGDFPPVPLRVLSAGRRPETMPNLRRFWAESQAALATLSPLGTQKICESCGHHIQREAPELVVAAIRSIVEPG